jgi:hypothetical protein
VKWYQQGLQDSTPTESMIITGFSKQDVYPLLSCLQYTIADAVTNEDRHIHPTITNHIQLTTSPPAPHLSLSSYPTKYHTHSNPARLILFPPSPTPALPYLTNKSPPQPAKNSIVSPHHLNSQTRNYELTPIPKHPALTHHAPNMAHRSAQLTHWHHPSITATSYGEVLLVGIGRRRGCVGAERRKSSIVVVREVGRILATTSG